MWGVIAVERNVLIRNRAGGSSVASGGGSLGITPFEEEGNRAANKHAYPDGGGVLARQVQRKEQDRRD